MEEQEGKEIPMFIISDGGKGGVGKSTTSRCLVDYLYSRGRPVAVLDADTSNADVERMFNTYAPCRRVDLSTEEGWMGVVDFVAEHQGHSIVLNTPAGIGKHVKANLSMLYNYLNETESGVPHAHLVHAWTFDIVPDSLSLFSQANADYGQFFARTIMVRNMFRGTPESFLFFNESQLPRQISKSGGIIVDMPALHLRVINKIYDPKTTAMPFSIAIDAALGESLNLSVSERRVLIDWRNKFDSLLKNAFAPITAAKEKSK